MDYEQKYKEALKRASNLHKDAVEMENNMTTKTCEIIFPELKEKESEDEDIKKELIAHFRNTRCVTEEGAEKIAQWVAWLEKQGEQKPSDKVEPKFKVDDCIVTDDSFWKNVRHIDEINLINEEYIVSDENGLYYILPFSKEHKWHKWTIQDAEDGDMVVDKSDGTIGIFQSIGHHPDGGSYNDPSYCFLYCRYDDGFFYADFEHGNTINSNDLIPATKEQRDTLEIAMTNAGYEWDAGKKELKKIERKLVDKIEPKFHEGEWVVLTVGELSTTLQIVNVDTGKKLYWFNDSSCLPLVDQECLHLWTIQDAKDSDVLQLGRVTAIFQKYISNGNCKCYCSVYDGAFEIPSQDSSYGCHNAIPATKEQRDLLFQKMADAGWEWDVEKKELKKFEPKFNVDDWIVTDDSFGKIVHHIDAISFNLIDKGYVVSDENGLIYNNISFDREHKWHKWTIQDAEDGDVLASELTGFIFLFKRIKDNKIDFYCDYDTRLDWPEDRFGINDSNQYYGRVEKSQDIHPATKEQRDLLFAKMKEAGYEWDAGKKELCISYEI